MVAGAPLAVDALWLPLPLLFGPLLPDPPPDLSRGDMKDWCWAPPEASEAMLSAGLVRPLHAAEEDCKKGNCEGVRSASFNHSMRV